MADSAIRATRRPLAPGEQITYPVPNSSATVTVHRTDNGHTGETVFLVYVAQGAHRPEGWTHTYLDELTARFEATRAAQLFKRYRTADAIEARRLDLVQAVRDEEHRQARGMHNPTVLAATRTELDSLMTLADMAALYRLRADLTALAAS